MIFTSGRPSPLAHDVKSFLLPVSRSLITAPDTADYFAPLIFQFIPDVKDSGDIADFEQLGDGIGRAEQYKMFKNGKSRQYTLSCTFAAHDETYDTNWVQQQVMRLRSFTKPVYDREKLFTTHTGYYAPPLIIFTHGKVWVNVPVVITQVSPTVPEEAALDKHGLPTVVQVEITMETNYPYGYVPGYLNYWKAWNDPSPNAHTGLNSKQLSFGGNITTTLDIAGDLFATEAGSTISNVVEL